MFMVSLDVEYVFVLSHKGDGKGHGKGNRKGNGNGDGKGDG